ncbi:elongin-C [Caerostris darwini]|uniref:Elongin-C n=1 Tax=Caerostris darwini TaxID=1538125 RepID=A0AAV4U624_9ARAC|nr:elongin-C [Caerostris darwini]
MSASKYGGCEGSDSTYVKLIACDGHEFILKRKYAVVSSVIRDRLSRIAAEGANEIRLEHFQPDMLEEICLYLMYKSFYQNRSYIPDFHIDGEIAYDLLLAAGYLDLV